jgi:hypothetical protein
MLLVTTASDALTHSGMSLRDAVAQANTDAAAGIFDTITFDSSLAGATITLAQGQLELSGAAASGGTITIDGSSLSSPITVSGGFGTTNSSRVFMVDKGVHAALNSLTITGGQIEVSDGGGIYNSGTLVITNALIASNFAIGKEGSLTVVNGGGIYNDGTLTVCCSTIDNNFAGIESRNTGTGMGGGIANGGLSDPGGAVTVSQVIVENNDASYGGGIANVSGTLTVANSTLYQDAAEVQGGGIYGTAVVSNSTIVGNYAGEFQYAPNTGPGGGIWGAVTLQNTIVAGNIDNPQLYAHTNEGLLIGAGIGADVSGTATGSHNLIGNGSGLSPGGISNGDTNHNQVGSIFQPINPLLLPLANYGGPTETLALLPGSPALAAGGPVATLRSAVTSGATTIAVSGAMAIASTPGSYLIQIDREQMLVTNVSGSNLTVIRGSNGTTAAAHNRNAPIYFATDQRGGTRTIPPDIGAYQANAQISAQLASVSQPDSMPVSLADITTVSPSGLTLASAPLFIWNAVTGADHYGINVSDATSPRAPALSDLNVAATSWPSPKRLTLGNTYQWSVTALDANGNTIVSSTPVSFTIATPFAGIYGGTYSGTAMYGGASHPQSGHFNLTVGNGAAITVISPGTGTGTAGQSGSVQITGQTSIQGETVSYLFVGMLTISDGAAAGGGTWTATFQDGTAHGTWSASATHLNGTPLDAPRTDSPSGPVTSLMPTFSWEPVGGADFYAVSVDDLTARRSQVLVASDVAGTSWTPAVPLTLGHTYQFEVQAETAGGNGGPWSAPTKFSLILASPVGQGPSGPTENATPTFNWNAVVNADSYDVKLLDDSAGRRQVAFQSHIGGTSWTPATPLVPGHSYEWLVRARSNNVTVSAFSAPVKFTVVPLAQPTLNAPGGFIENPTPTFRWSSVSNADFYAIRLKDVTTGAAISNPDVSATSVAAPKALTLGNVYQWQVQALSANGDVSAWSSPAKFTVINPFAGKYTVQITGSLAGKPINLSGDLIVNNVGIAIISSPLTAGGTLYYKQTIDEYGALKILGYVVQHGSKVGSLKFTATITISSGTAMGSGPWQISYRGKTASGIWSLTTTQLTGSPLDTPVLGGLSGANAPATPTFTWSSVPNATYYGVTVIDVTAGNKTALQNNDVTSTSWTPTMSLTAGHQYLWWVAAFDDNGDASPRASVAFTVGP